MLRRHPLRPLPLLLRPYEDEDVAYAEEVNQTKYEDDIGIDVLGLPEAVPIIEE